MADILMPRLLTVRDVAAQCGLSTARVYELVRQKRLPAVHFGRQIRVSQTTLREFISHGGASLSGPERGV